MEGEEFSPRGDSGSLGLLEGRRGFFYRFFVNPDMVHVFTANE
jgi:hypothetical protein